MSRYASTITIFALSVMVAGCASATPTADSTPETQPAAESPAAAEAEAATAAAPESPESTDQPYQPTEAQRPASVLAVAVVPNPLAFAQNAAAYAQNAKLPLPFTPDSIGDVMMSALQSNGASGVRIDAPAYVVVADADGAKLPVALVLPTSDADAVATAIREQASDLDVLAANGYVVAGEAPVLALVADYALTGLRAEPLPAHPTVTAFGPTLRQKYAVQLGMARAFVGGMKNSGDPDEAMGAGIIEMYMGLIEQIETMTMSLEASADLTSLVFTMTGAAGTSLAAFAEAQKPAEFSELAYLPNQDGVFLAAGRMDWRPIAGALAAMSQMTTAIAPNDGKAAEMPNWDAILEMMSDEFAMAVSYDKTMAMVGSYRTSAPDKARDKMVAWWKEFASAPMFDAKKTRVRTRRIRGKSVTLFEYALAEAIENPELAEAMKSILGKPPYRSAVVALPERLGFASLGGTRKQIAGLVKRSAKPGSADLPSWAALAKGRSESFAHVFDGSVIARELVEEAEEPDEAAEIVAKIPAGILIPQGMGFVGRTTSFRTSIPAAVAELIGKAAMSVD